jgi:F-type H+-transporting ATPase subunit b
MLIDWFTAGAQALNFIILVWLLKRFLYKPILNAIDAREKRIAAELTAAEGLKSQAQKSRDEFDGKNKQFETDRDALMAEAVIEVKTERARLLDEARKTAEELLEKQRSAARNDATVLTSQMMHLAATEVFDVARQALNDLACMALEERLVEIFTRRLREMKPEAKQLLGIALTAPNSVVVVRSRFDLAAREQATIQNALHEMFSTDTRSAFVTAPDGICGIELTVGGQRLSWSIGGYLRALEEKTRDLISGQIKPSNAAPEPKAVVAAEPAAPIAMPTPAPAEGSREAERHALAS